MSTHGSDTLPVRMLLFVYIVFHLAIGLALGSTWHRFSPLDFVIGKMLKVLNVVLYPVIKNNRAILLSIIDVIISLGQRNYSLRGHGWNKDTKREDGNFDFFLHWKAQFDPCLL